MSRLTLPELSPSGPSEVTLGGLFGLLSTKLAFNVRAYGAVGDGASHPLSTRFATLAAAQAVYPFAVALTDELDWCGWQAAINAAFAAGGAGVTAFAGTYLINEPLSFVNMFGVHACGAGRASKDTPAVTLRWTGAAGGTLINANGLAFALFERLGFFGDNATPWSDNTQTGVSGLGNPTYHGSFEVGFTDCFFQNFGVAVNLGTSSDQADTWSFTRTRFYIGPTSTGVKINSYNSLEIRFFATSFVGGSTLTSSKGVDLRQGSIYMYGCQTGNLDHGINIGTGPTFASSTVVGHHSEGDNYALYTESAGTHQKAWPLNVHGLYVYHSLLGSLYLANADWQYDIHGLFTVPSGGNDSITVSVGCQEVWLWDATFGGTIKDTSGTTVILPGWYGAQGTGTRPQRSPALSVQTQATADVPIKITANGATANMMEGWYGGNAEFRVSPDGKYISAASVSGPTQFGLVGPSSQSAVKLVETSIYRQTSGVLRTTGAWGVQAVATGSRPSAATVGAGAVVFDTTLNKPVWSDGTTWRDATGTAV